MKVKPQADPHKKQEEVYSDDRVGDIDLEGGFGLGKASPGAKPKETFYTSPTKSEPKANKFNETKNKLFTQGITTFENEEKNKILERMPEKQVAFEEFKESKGSEIVELIERDKNSQKDLRIKIKEKSEECQELKSIIESRAFEVKELKENNPDQYAEVYELLKTDKTNYKHILVDVKELKNE